MSRTFTTSCIFLTVPGAFLWVSFDHVSWSVTCGPGHGSSWERTKSQRHGRIARSLLQMVLLFAARGKWGLYSTVGSFPVVSQVAQLLLRALCLEPSSSWLCSLNGTVPIPDAFLPVFRSPILSSGTHPYISLLWFDQLK